MHAPQTTPGQPIGRCNSWFALDAAPRRHTDASLRFPAVHSPQSKQRSPTNWMQQRCIAAQPSSQRHIAAQPSSQTSCSPVYDGTSAHPSQRRPRRSNTQALLQAPHTIPTSRADCSSALRPMLVSRSPMLVNHSLHRTAHRPPLAYVGGPLCQPLLLNAHYWRAPAVLPDVSHSHSKTTAPRTAQQAEAPPGHKTQRRRKLQGSAGQQNEKKKRTG